MVDMQNQSEVATQRNSEGFGQKSTFFNTPKKFDSGRGEKTQLSVEALREAIKNGCLGCYLNDNSFLLKKTEFLLQENFVPVFSQKKVMNTRNTYCL